VHLATKRACRTSGCHARFNGNTNGNGLIALSDLAARIEQIVSAIRSSAEMIVDRPHDACGTDPAVGSIDRESHGSNGFQVALKADDVRALRAIQKRGLHNRAFAGGVSPMKAPPGRQAPPAPCR
jgi:hypothetical protein